jgi:hypothetical protein
MHSVGFAEAEMKATDAVTGQILAGANDKRAGGICSQCGGAMAMG